MDSLNSQHNNNGAVDPGTKNNGGHLLRSSAGYLANAFREGFKQNFLGYDIDMDFVMISLQSLRQTSGEGIKHLISKYTTAGRQAINKRIYHNSTTLSHS